MAALLTRQMRPVSATCAACLCSRYALTTAALTGAGTTLQSSGMMRSLMNVRDSASSACAFILASRSARARRAAPVPTHSGSLQPQRISVARRDSQGLTVVEHGRHGAALARRERAREHALRLLGGLRASDAQHGIAARALARHLDRRRLDRRPLAHQHGHAHRAHQLRLGLFLPHARHGLLEGGRRRATATSLHRCHRPSVV